MKKVQLTEQQLKETMIRAVKLHEAKKLVERLVREKVVMERKNQKLINKYINEFSGMQNVWQGLKQAGSDFGQKMGLSKDPLAPGKAPNMGPSQADIQAKSALKHLTNLNGQVDKTRQKFQNELLKDTEVISNYYDSVLNLSREAGKYGEQYGQGSLEMAKMANLAQQKVQQLRMDLEEEATAIQSFLKSFNQDVNKTADEQETDESGRSSAGRATAAAKTGKMQTYDTQKQAKK